MKFTIEFIKPVPASKALVIWGYIKNLEQMTFSETLKFCNLFNEGYFQHVNIKINR